MALGFLEGALIIQGVLRNRAGGCGTKTIVGVRAAGGTTGFDLKVQGWPDQIEIHRNFGGALALLHPPNLFGRLDLAKIVDAGAGLRQLPGLDEVWNRDGHQQTDNGDHDHYFHQSKPRPR